MGLNKPDGRVGLLDGQGCAGGTLHPVVLAFKCDRLGGAPQRQRQFHPLDCADNALGRIVGIREVVGQMLGFAKGGVSKKEVASATDMIQRCHHFGGQRGLAEEVGLVDDPQLGTVGRACQRGECRSAFQNGIFLTQHQVIRHPEIVKAEFLRPLTRAQSRGSIQAGIIGRAKEPPTGGSKDRQAEAKADWVGDL